MIMCGSCGCESENLAIKITNMAQHGHSHPDGTPHHHHQDEREHTLAIKENVMQHNDLLAAQNRGYLKAKRIFTLNLVSSPGAGKTTLLEKTISLLKSELNFYVIEGDQQTLNDALRIEKTGVPVVQINTGNGCHLDAQMVSHAIDTLHVKEESILVIENVGNLVCPAMFDLGETKRVVIVSVTEGEDKPLKYPNMFASADVCIISKVDLLPHLIFDFEKLVENARKVNPKITIIEYSAFTHDDKWKTWIKNEFDTYINASTKDTRVTF